MTCLEVVCDIPRFPYTVKPVCNDHLSNKIYYLLFIQWCVLMKTEGSNSLLLTISAFWSSSRWPMATWMSSRRQRNIPLGGRYRQVSLYHIDGLVHDCSNSNVWAIELLPYCTKVSISTTRYGSWTYLYPNDRHTMFAVCWSRLSSQTVPQTPLWSTSIRPFDSLTPLTKRNAKNIKRFVL